jgi:hypothetical protein
MNETTTFTLRFDPNGTSISTDGASNPAWRHVAEEFDISDGDIGNAGVVRVAIHTVDNGRYYGRDWEGSAVVLTEK